VKAFHTRERGNQILEKVMTFYSRIIDSRIHKRKKLEFDEFRNLFRLETILIELVTSVDTDRVRSCLNLAIISKEESQGVEVVFLRKLM